MSELPAITVLQGRPCAGKSVLYRELRKAFPLLEPVPSNTTRKRRGDENPGEYIFLGEDAFREMEMLKLFAWTAQPYPGGPWYGTANKDLDIALSEGNRVIILAGDSPYTLLRMAKEKGQCRDLCFIYLLTSTDREGHPLPAEEQERLLLLRADEHRDVEKVREQLKKSRDWDEQALTSNLPYHFINALQTQERVIEDAIRILCAHNPAP